MELRGFASVLLVLPLFCKSAQASAADCAYACHDPAARLQFNGSSPEDDYYVAQCTNLLRVQSVFYCMKTYCSEKDIRGGLKTVTSDCMVYGKQDILPWSVIDNITRTEAESWPHVGVEDLDNTNLTYDTPVYLSESLFQLSLQTSVSSATRSS